MLNCIDKILEKIITEQLSQFFKTYFKPQLGQIGAWKEQSAIDAIVMLVHIVQEKWSEKKLASALFIDVKKVFDHVSRSQLLK